MFTRAPATSKPQCQDSMPLSVRYKSNITLPDSVEGANFQSLSVSRDGTVMAGLIMHDKLFLYKVERSITHTCFVKCNVHERKLIVWTPRDNIMCLGDKGDITVVRPSGLIETSSANNDFTRPCSSTRIRSNIIVKDAQHLQHASVSVQGVPANYVTYMYKCIY